MKKDVNKIVLLGRLGTEPIQRETKNGHPVVHFSMATSRWIQSETQTADQGREETQWHKVVVWGRQAEACKQYLSKGQQVYVEGMMRSHKYTAKNGESRLSFEVHADNVIFLNRKRPNGSPESVALETEEVAASA